MKTSRKIALGIAAGLGIAASAAVLAHGHGSKMGHGPGDCGPMARGMAGGLEAHLDTLKTELKLTAEQEPAWQAFEKTARAQMSAHHADQPATAEGADPMQARIAHMEQRLAGMKEVQKARTELYQVLTPEQRAVLDRAGPRGRHGRHG